MKINILIILLSFVLVPAAFSQDTSTISWWNPADCSYPVIEGQAWPDRVGSRYDRLPKDAENKVRKEVWSLSGQSAGLMIRFRSNSARILVRYGLKNDFAMSHMPATGVSGVDLYARDADGKWLWRGGKRSFSDTVRYEFQDMVPNDQYHERGREYRLYLPLYNKVNWLEIGVPGNALFEALPVRREKPIVVYGTSIAQGGCASRPGMAWTSILERKMDRPLINLGFSGNGRLEKEVIDLMGEIDAKIYVLDCLPNLVSHVADPAKATELKKLILSSVRQLKEKRPSVPVLLVDHAGYGAEKLVEEDKREPAELNKINRQAYAQLKEEGVTRLYFLARDEMALDFESFVDGVHPTDLGMQQYASAYEKCIREILNEPSGKSPTSLPVTQYREPQKYDWEKRHQEILRLNKEMPPKICLLGNSIVHYWGGITKGPFERNSESWNRDMEPLGIRNFGFGWDRIENLLWRVYHDELEGYSARQVVIMIGTNNLNINTDDEILEGLELLVQAIKVRQPESTVFLSGLLPRKNMEMKILELNLLIARLAGKTGVKFADPGKVLLNYDGKINESLFSDGLHPNPEGYRKLTPVILSWLKE